MVTQVPPTLVENDVWFVQVRLRTCLAKCKNSMRTLSPGDLLRDDRYLHHALRAHLWYAGMVLQTAASRTADYCGPIYLSIGDCT